MLIIDILLLLIAVGILLMSEKGQGFLENVLRFLFAFGKIIGVLILLIVTFLAIYFVAQGIGKTGLSIFYWTREIINSTNNAYYVLQQQYPILEYLWLPLIMSYPIIFEIRKRKEAFNESGGVEEMKALKRIVVASIFFLFTVILVVVLAFLSGDFNV